MTPTARPIMFALAFIACWAVAWRFDTTVVLFGFAGATAAGGLVQLTADQRRAVAQRIREALRDAGLQMNTAAALMQFDSPADLNHMLDDPTRKLDMWRLEMLPDDFHAHLALLELRDRGLPAKIQHALRMLPALDALRRSA